MNEGPVRATSVGVMALAHLTNDSYAYMLPALLPLLLGKLGKQRARHGRDVGRRQALEKPSDPRRPLGGDEAELRPVAADRVHELGALARPAARALARIFHPELLIN